MSDQATSPGDRRPTESTPAEDSADPQDFFVPRNSAGDLQTTTTRAEGFGEIEVLPMTYGDAEEYFGDAGQATMVGPGVIADVIGNHIVEPDLDAWVRANYSQYDGFNGQVVSNEMNPMAPQALLLAIMETSGISPDIEMTGGGGAEIAFEQEGN